MIEIDRARIKKILIIKTGALGDIVRSFPALVSVAKIFPEARISFLIGEQYVELIEPCPYISEIIPYRKRRNTEDLFGFLRVARDIRSRGFDLVLNFQNTKRFDLVAKASGAEYRSGIVTLDRPINGVEGVFKILETVGLQPKRRHYEFWFDEKDLKYAEGFFERHGVSEADRIAGINPGGGWESKQWALERYADLADRLTETAGARVVVFGSAEERGRAEEIARLAEHPVIINSGESTVRQAACAISRCSVFVSNDSGLMHVAAHQDVPTVGIFGSTNPAYHGPCREGNVAVYRGVDCSPCSDPECRLDFETHYCLRAITVDQVFKEARGIMR